MHKPTARAIFAVFAGRGRLLKGLMALAAISLAVAACTSANPTATPTRPVPTATTPPLPTPVPTATPAPSLLTLTPAPTPAVTPLEWRVPVTSDCSFDDANHRVQYAVSGKTVRGYFYRPQGAGPFPAVLFLHGSAGLIPPESVSQLADSGYVVIEPDYFTPEGLPTPNSNTPLVLSSYVDGIREDLAGGLDCMKSLSYVLKGRIGVVGFSLGGYFGVLLATRDDVGAVVSYYGAYLGRPIAPVAAKYGFDDIAAQVKAPILMLHGDADTTARVSLANGAYEQLRKNGKQATLIIYPGVEHRFNSSRAPTYDQKAAADASSKTLDFLRQSLK